MAPSTKVGATLLGVVAGGVLGSAWLHLAHCQLGSPLQSLSRAHSILQVLRRHGADRVHPIPGPGHLAALPSHGPTPLLASL